MSENYRKEFYQLSAVVAAILRTTGPVTISKEDMERQVSLMDVLKWDKHDDGSATVRLASVHEQDAAASQRESHVSTSLPVERPVSAQDNED